MKYSLRVCWSQVSDWTFQCRIMICSDANDHRYPHQIPIELILFMAETERRFEDTFLKFIWSTHDGILMYYTTKHQRMNTRLLRMAFLKFCIYILVLYVVSLVKNLTKRGPNSFLSAIAKLSRFSRVLFFIVYKRSNSKIIVLSPKLLHLSHGEFRAISLVVTHVPWGMEKHRTELEVRSPRNFAFNWTRMLFF